MAIFNSYVSLPEGIPHFEEKSTREVANHSAVLTNIIPKYPK